MIAPCTCNSCVNACKLQPGWLAPGEAERIAAYLNISMTDVEKMLIIDHCDNHSIDNAPYVYAPRKIGVDRADQKIRTYGTQRKTGTCVFLKNDRCSIHDVKPYECKNTMCCDFHYGVRDDIENLWIKAGAPLGMRPEELSDEL